MPKLATFVLCLLFALPAAAQDHTLRLSHPLEGISKIAVKGGVGEVEITTDPPAHGLTARVELSRKGGVLSSRRRRALEASKLAATVEGDTLTLRVVTPHHGHNFSEEWTLHLPPEIAVSVKLGVGDVTILDLGSDIEVDLGVGNVHIEGKHRAFGDIKASAGVGDVTLRTPAGRQSGEGFVGHSLHARGGGEARMAISIGVGDVDIRLR